MSRKVHSRFRYLGIAVWRINSAYRNTAAIETLENGSGHGCEPLVCFGRDVPRDFYRALSNGTGRAQNNDALPFHQTVPREHPLPAAGKKRGAVR